MKSYRFMRQHANIPSWDNTAAREITGTHCLGLDVVPAKPGNSI